MTDAAAPRRILMSADTVGGVWSYALGLAGAWAGQGVETVLAAIGPLSPAQRAAAGAIEGVVLRAVDARLEWMQGAAGDVAGTGRWLLDLERRFAPDLVQINGYAHAALPFAAPVIAVAHSDVLSWHAAVQRRPAGPEWRAYAAAMREGLANARMVVAPTHAVLDDLAHHGMRWHAAAVIPNGIDPGRFAPRPKQAVVLAAGRAWDAAKNLAALDRVAAVLPWPVEIAGETRHPEGGDVRFVRAVTLGALTPGALADRLATAAIFAAPARYEPFGLAILEAAASGCALVLGDIASLRELWDGAALFVAPDDEPALADALAGLIGDPDRRADLAERARRRAGRFDQGRMAETYLGAFRGLLTASRGAA